jgi:hypothetical protein
MGVRRFPEYPSIAVIVLQHRSGLEFGGDHLAQSDIIVVADCHRAGLAVGIENGA